MSELSRITTHLWRLDSLLVRANREQQRHPGHAKLAATTQGLEATRLALTTRFEVLASKEWVDVCNYRLRSADGFLPLAGITGTLSSFQNALSQTMDSIMRGVPRSTQHLSRVAEEESALRFGYTQIGDTSGDLDLVLLSENRRDLMDQIGCTADKVFAVAGCRDTEKMHEYSQTLGSAPIRAISEWSNSHIISQTGADVSWIRDNQPRVSIRKSLDDWKELKEIIGLVSDVKTEEIEVEGVLVAANVKTHAFAIECGDEVFSGKFVDGLISSNRAASLPWRYRFVLRKTMTENYATNRIHTRYQMTNLEDLGRSAPSEGDTL